MATKVEKVEVNADDVRAVTEYLEDDEYKHWEEAGKPAEHIYHTVMRLKQSACNHSEYDYEDLDEGLLVECQNCEAQYEREPPDVYAPEGS